MTGVAPVPLTVTDAELVLRLGRQKAARLTRLPTALPNPPVPPVPADPGPQTQVEVLLELLLDALDHLSLEPVNAVFAGRPPVCVATHRLADRSVRETVTPDGLHTFLLVPAASSRAWLAAQLDDWAGRADGALTVLSIRGYDAERLQFLDLSASGWTVRPLDVDGPASGGGLTSREALDAVLDLPPD